MRTFVAIRPCAAALDALLAVQADLDQGRLVPEENLHVTLAFLDDQPECALEALHAALAEIRGDGVALTFSGVDVRGGRKPVLIWSGVEASAPLVQLQARVQAAAHCAGITLPRRRFRPHVTLSRIRRTAPVDPARLGAWLARQGAFRAGPFPVARFGLFRSDLTPDGPIYDQLAPYPLAGERSVSGE